MTILEVARTLQKLISEGKLARPARTIRFIWPPEIEGTMALLNSDYSSISPLRLVKKIPDSETGDKFLEHYEPATAFRPFYKRIKAVVHMDMVGGGPETKAVFHVTRGPMSLPSFVHDVAWAFAEFVNEESYKFAATGKAEYPLVAPEGGKEPLRAEYSAYTMLSDYDVYQDSSFGIPAIYLNDWPDRYIHTNFDTAANIDPTKLKRAAFIGAASGYFLAGISKNDLNATARISETGYMVRGMRVRQAMDEFPREVVCYMNRDVFSYELGVESSLKAFIDSKVPETFSMNEADCPVKFSESERQEVLLIFRRKSAPYGPLTVFGYDYLSERLSAAAIPVPKILDYTGRWGSGEEYAYEILNFADGKHLHCTYAMRCRRSMGRCRWSWWWSI